MSEVVQLCPGCAIAWTVARIAAGLDIWQGLQPSDYGRGCACLWYALDAATVALLLTPGAVAWTVYS